MTKNTIKTIIMVVAILLVLALAGGWIAQAVVSKQKEPVYNQAADNAKDGMQVELENNDSGIQFASARIATEDYGEYGVSALAESAYTINATVTPANSPNKSLKWALSFANPTSSWADGKTLSDYVTLTSSGTQATLSCKKAFGEPIIVTATSTANTSKSAQCRLNYKQKITDVTFELGTMTYKPMNGSFHYNKGMKYVDCKIFPTFSKEINAEYSVEIKTSTDYTIAADNIGVRFEMLPVQSFIQSIDNLGYNGAGLSEYIVTANANDAGTIEHFFDIGWAENILGAPFDVESRNEMIEELGNKVPIAYQLSCYIGNADEPVHTYRIFIDFNDVKSEYDIENVTFDKSEIEF